VQAVSGPYKEWAEGKIQHIRGVLQGARDEHTQVVKARIDSVQQLKDVVSVTKGLFEVSKVRFLFFLRYGTRVLQTPDPPCGWPAPI
jgi:hypothetical protein